MSRRPLATVMAALAMATTGCLGAGGAGIVDLVDTVDIDGHSASAAGLLPPVTLLPTEETTPANKTVGTQPARGRLVIQAVGDVNLDPSYVTGLRTEGYHHAFDGLDGLFADDDLTIVNLECTVSPLGTPLPKDFTFRCDDDGVAAARAAGVDVANLANNHSGDHGVDALLDSVVRVEAAGIAPVGVGIDEAAAVTPAYLDVEGWRVAIIGFGGVVPAPAWVAGKDHPGMADGDDLLLMAAAVAEADAHADVVIVVVHWGVELDLGPRPDDVARADAMIAAGADMVFGSHPHRLQPLETRNGVPVAWSLGNFVWPAFSGPGADTAVARVVVEPDGTIRSCLLHATIVSSGHPTLDDPSTRTCPDE